VTGLARCERVWHVCGTTISTARQSVRAGVCFTPVNCQNFECPQKDSNLRTWLRRPPGCTEMLTHYGPDGKARTDVRVASRPSA
jgi:hypothetical protein